MNSRKIGPVFAPVRSARDKRHGDRLYASDRGQNILAVFSASRAANVDCYLVSHDTPIIGASLTAAQGVAKRKLHGSTTSVSDSDLIPKEMAIFKQEGAFAGETSVSIMQTSLTRPR